MKKLYFCFFDKKELDSMDYTPELALASLTTLG